MKSTCQFFSLAALALVLPSTAHAACHKSQVCDDYGRHCHIQDVCNSTLDLPSVELAPLQPLPSTQIKPLPSTDLPPLGTSRCEYVQVNGQWQNICK